MPPTLDLTQTYTHADMLLSSRKSPRLSLRKTGSYNSNDRGPLSSTSSRFSFNHLINSPPPSPGLPALIPRHGKPVPTQKPRKAVRTAMWVLGALAMVYYGFSCIQSTQPRTQVGWANNAGEEFEMVSDSELPDFPTPVVVIDKRGRAKWTVSIPPDTEFPLEPNVYADICQQNDEVAMLVTELHTHSHNVHPTHEYYHVDANFMDVAEAEAHGLLPGSMAKTTMKIDGVVGENLDSLIDSPVCEKTMTFLLETDDAGLGKTLMMMWMSYGLAKKEGREFFVNDSRWSYGKYTDFFLSPPMPKCRPPPRHEMLPCPRHARHLIVSASTASSTFGGAFTEQFEDPRKMEVQRQKPIYDLARAGYKALFHLATNDSNYVQERVLEFRNQTEGIVVGIHVRHGDRHPYEFQYKDSYIPLSIYSSTARSTNDDPLLIIASDDPDVYTSDEFSTSQRAQDLIKLASKDSFSKPKPSSDPIRKFIEEHVGWEGGFFAAMYWSLGRPASLIGGQRVMAPSEESARLRELVGRAYLLDLAVLGNSDRVVCTVSSMGCRLLGVMLGWDSVIDGRWKNVDGEFEWRGLDW